MTTKVEIGENYMNRVSGEVVTVFGKTRGCIRIEYHEPPNLTDMIGKNIFLRDWIRQEAVL